MKKISGNSEFKRIKRFYCEEGDLLMASELHLKNNNPITIKDISAKLNVSSVSVHRALSGKDGVSENCAVRYYRPQRKWGMK